jgi:diguanylate cyclase (GGDEF)-like protein/PAS domain S-box-containing protein
MPKRGRRAQGKPRGNAAQLRLIADSLPAMSIAYDENLRCLFANRRFAEFFSLTSASIVGKHLREIIGEGPYQEVKPYFDRVLEGHRATYKRTRALDNGELRHLEVELIPHIGQDGRTRGLFTVTTDVTERKREEQLRNLGDSVAELIASADSSTEAVQAVIRAICETERWDCGRYFQASPNGSVRRFAGGWGIEDAAIQEFLRHSKDIEFLPGSGIIDKVWHSGNAQWVAEVGNDPRALRKAYPAELLSGGVFQFPVKLRGTVIGVLIFNSRERRTPDQQLLRVILDIGSRIGQFLRRKHAEERLRESEANLAEAQRMTQQLIEALPNPIYFKDTEGHYLGVNRAWEAFFGTPRKMFLGKTVHDLYPDSPEIAERLRADDQVLWDKPGTPHMHEESIVTPDGKRHEAIYYKATFTRADGGVAGLVGTIIDITAQKRAEERIQYVANHDSLTGLPNRLLFNDRLDQAISLAKRDARQLALLYLDLDKFKPVNDSLGHDAGDQVLIGVAGRLREQVRESDTVARVGGDEFAVILRDISGPQDAATVAQKIIDNLATPFRLGDHSEAVEIGTSIGIAVYPSDAQDRDSLIKKADTTMYGAKTRGNCYLF